MSREGALRAGAKGRGTEANRRVTRIIRTLLGKVRLLCLQSQTSLGVSGHKRGDSTPAVQRRAEPSRRVAPPGLFTTSRGTFHLVGVRALRHPSCEGIPDDLAARKCAAVLSIPVRGTLGIIVLAKQAGHLPEVVSVLDRIRQAGLSSGPEV